MMGCPVLGDLALPLRDMPEDELRATAVDFVAQREERTCAC